MILNRLSSCSQWDLSDKCEHDVIFSSLAQPRLSLVGVLDDRLVLSKMRGNTHVHASTPPITITTVCLIVIKILDNEDVLSSQPSLKNNRRPCL
jgi:hypothetical protein